MGDQYCIDLLHVISGNILLTAVKNLKALVVW